MILLMSTFFFNLEASVLALFFKLSHFICLCFSFHSFELNSDMFEDQPFLSISNRPYEESDSVRNSASSQHDVSGAGYHSLQFPCKWPHNSTLDETGLSKMSEQECEEIDLEKNLLNQQCGELREELALKERDLSILREEVIKSAEELAEARDR